MVEVIAIVRANKTSETKAALLKVGCPGFTCQRCRGRGKEPVDITMPDGSTVKTKLVSKRIFNIFCDDEKQDAVVSALIEVNSTGNQGDGKIFVCPVENAYNIREGVASDKIV